MITVDYPKGIPYEGVEIVYNDNLNDDSMDAYKVKREGKLYVGYKLYLDFIFLNGVTEEALNTAIELGKKRADGTIIHWTIKNEIENLENKIQDALEWNDGDYLRSYLNLAYPVLTVYPSEDNQGLFSKIEYDLNKVIKQIAL